MTVRHTQMMGSKHCIDLAIEKANIAVKYDSANDVDSAIAAYTEAVQLLFHALQQQQQSEGSAEPSQGSADQHDIDGLTSICNIYMERIDHLSQLKGVLPQEQQHFISSTNDTSSHKSSKFNSVFLNIFHKKSSNKKKKSFNFHHHHHQQSQEVHSTPPMGLSPAAISTISSLEDAPSSPTHLSVLSLPQPKSSKSTPLPDVVSPANNTSFGSTAAKTTHLSLDTTPDSWRRSSISTSSFSDNFQQYIGKALSSVSPTASTQERFQSQTNASASTIYYYKQQQKQHRQQEEEEMQRNSYAEGLPLSHSSTSSSDSTSSNSSSTSLSSSNSSSGNSNSSQHHALMTQQCQKQYNMNYINEEQQHSLSPTSSSFLYLNNNTSSTTSNNTNNIPFKRLLKSGGGVSASPTTNLNSTVLMIDPNIILNYPEAKVI